MVCPHCHYGCLVGAEQKGKLVSYVLSVDLLILNRFHCGFSFGKDKFDTVRQHGIESRVVIFCDSVRMKLLN
jgi:hypothetical protein